MNFTMDGHQREGLLHPDSLQAASPYAQVDMVTKLHTYWFKIQRTRNMGNESVEREGGWGEEGMGLQGLILWGLGWVGSPWGSPTDAGFQKL